MTCGGGFTKVSNLGVVECVQTMTTRGRTSTTRHTGRFPNTTLESQTPSDGKCDVTMTCSPGDIASGQQGVGPLASYPWGP